MQPTCHASSAIKIQFSSSFLWLIQIATTAENTNVVRLDFAIECDSVETILQQVEALALGKYHKLDQEPSESSILAFLSNISAPEPLCAAARTTPSPSHDHDTVKVTSYTPETRM
jgi:hypothetical protein